MGDERGVRRILEGKPEGKQPIEASREVEEVIRNDHFVLSMKHIKPRRRLRGSVETLFAVDFPGSQQKFVLMLDRRSKRDGRTRAQHYTVDTLSENTILRSLILSVTQKEHSGHVTLYVDCVSQGMVATPRNMREMFHKMTSPRLQVFRERRYELEVDSGTLSSVLNRNNCPTNHLQMQAIEPEVTTNEINSIRRGDIPVIHDCDERDNLVLKTLKEVTASLKNLKEEVSNQRSEIHYMRELLEQCELCAPAPPRVTCSSNPSPCFPGAQCQDTAEGPRCGQCPRGYVGDGRNCKPGLKCEDRPCYPGVRCYDTVDGFQCGPCPSGYHGDGVRCKARNACENNPCAPVFCSPCKILLSYTVLFTLQCDLAEPCDPRVRCTNLNPGYRCDPCPAGYTGSSGVEGIGLEEAYRKRQQCQDIDECADGRNGGCTPNSICKNYEGSYTCGECQRGYVGNQSIGCHNSPGLCPDGTQCDNNAHCVRKDNGYSCVDNCVGIPNSGQEDADRDGLGDICDEDADNDGIPNSPDNCPLVANPDQSDTDQDAGDKQGDACDNCPTIPNFDQEDTDKDGKGDACDEDLDDDRIPNHLDNCPRKSNPDQRDSDGDGLGDVCDNCPRVPNTNQVDSDNDLVGDACDSDMDRDRSVKRLFTVSLTYTSISLIE
ncbi:Thrombospondin-4 [Blattella germanica]|nr:Thrombospondin-4 [Blattella germanica]